MISSEQKRGRLFFEAEWVAVTTEIASKKHWRDNILFVTSRHWITRNDPELLTENLKDPLPTDIISVDANPTFANVEAYLELIAGKSYSGIIALGGGSVIDVAKILKSFLIPYQGTTQSCGIEPPNNIKTNSNIDLIAIPTTAGTGSEVTSFATLWDIQNRQKVSIESAKLTPEYVILDPSLLRTLDGPNLIFPFIDSVSHALESLWNHNRNPISEIYAAESLKLACKYFIDTDKGLVSIDQINLLQRSSLLAGLAIADTRTAIAHSISYPLTLHYGVPHGLAASFLLPKLIDLHLEGTNERFSAELLDIKALLLTLELPTRLLSFAEHQQIRKLAPEMLASTRANNFSSQISHQDLLSLLASTLG